MQNGYRNLYYEVITALLTVLDSRNRHTWFHSKRVGVMAENFCIRMDLDESVKEEITLAAYCHDIGMTGVPEPILYKPGPLNKLEWDIIKMHPVTGAEILSRSEGLEAIEEMVLHHHENWDGSGYPYGLRGEEIPYGARIIHICEAVDAMLEERTYRKALTEAQCKEELRKYKSVRYDPRLTERFLECWEEIMEKRIGKK